MKSDERQQRIRELQERLDLIRRLGQGFSFCQDEPQVCSLMEETAGTLDSLRRKYAGPLREMAGRREREAPMVIVYGPGPDR